MTWNEDWDRADAEREKRRTIAARVRYPFLSDDELLRFGEEVERNYAGRFMVRENGGVRPLTNMEMHALRFLWKQLNDEARIFQRFLIALETWIDSGCPITIGGNHGDGDDEYESGVGGGTRQATVA